MNLAFQSLLLKSSGVRRYIYNMINEFLFCKVQSSFFLLVCVETVKLLTDDNLAEPGMIRIGDRALFRSKCREAEQSKCTVSEKHL